MLPEMIADGRLFRSITAVCGFHAVGPFPTGFSILKEYIVIISDDSFVKRGLVLMAAYHIYFIKRVR